MVLIDVPELLIRIENGERSKIEGLWDCAVVIDGNHKVSDLVDDVRRACDKSGSTFDMFSIRHQGFDAEVISIIVNARDITKRIAIHIYDYMDFHRYSPWYQQNHYYEVALYDVDTTDYVHINYWALDVNGVSRTFAISMHLFFEDIYHSLSRSFRCKEVDTLDAFFEEY